MSHGIFSPSQLLSIFYWRNWSQQNFQNRLREYRKELVFEVDKSI